MLAHGEKRPMLALAALAFSIFVVIPLSFIFDGCTSTSSPSSSYFMKVNLTEFPKLKAIHIRQSVSISDIDNSNLADGTANIPETATKIAANSVSQATSAAGSEVAQASEHVQSLADHLKSHLPTSYTVGLRSYCQENRDTTFSNCSTVSNSFSFDLLSLFGSFSDEINSLLPSNVEKVFETYHKTSRFAILAYIIGTAATGLTIVFNATWSIFHWGNFVFPPLATWWLELLTLVFSSFASILILCASAAITAIHVATRSAIQNALQSYGAHANLGGLLVAAWFAVVISVIASFLLYFARRS